MSGLAERSFANDVREIRRMSEWWREWTASNAIPPDVRERGELCLNEAAGNVVQHSAGATTIHASLLQENGVVRIELSDDGPPFDPSTSSRRPLPETLVETQPGGLGLHILHSYAEAVSYRRDGDVNVLTLTFRCGRT